MKSMLRLGNVDKMYDMCYNKPHTKGDMIKMKNFNIKKNFLLLLVGIFMFSIFSDVNAETLNNNIVDYKIKEFKV